ncbi:uncharacterized protein LOC134805562 [Cydia splendana]
MNAEGENILQFAITHDLAIVNTFFAKPLNHLITYKSGGASTQIDYILADRPRLKTFKDCKVIPGEPLTSQHRILVAEFTMPKPVKVVKDKVTNIRWHKLDRQEGNYLTEDITIHLKEMQKLDSTNAKWDHFRKLCTERAIHHLGMSKGPIHDKKDTKWWQGDVKQKIDQKKIFFKIWQHSKDDKDLDLYKVAKKEAKRAVAQARASSRDDFYTKLEAAITDKEIFQIAKQRHNNSKDTKTIKYIKDKSGRLLTSNKEIQERWKEYYSNLLNETYPCKPLPEIPCVQGPIPSISKEEVETAIKKMANHKATGPDEIPAELLKRLGDEGVSFLTDLFNGILTDGIPDKWRRSYLVPFFKNKGDLRDCGNYRAIKLIPHSFKIWERVISKRLSQLTNISENQCGFVAGKSTTDALHTLRLLIENYRDNKADLHMVFIDLEKAFDRVPRKLIWHSLRAKNVPEYYISIVMDMYKDVKSTIRSPAGNRMNSMWGWVSTRDQLSARYYSIW